MTMIDAPSPGGLGLSMNIVRLVNESTSEFRMRYGPNEWLIIPVNGETAVIEEVAWHFLGRWWMDNSNPRRRERQIEYDRLRTLFGAYEAEAVWEQNRPRLAAYTMAGERITTVADDPEGRQTNTVGTPMSREQGLEAQMDVMSRELLRIQGELERVKTNPAPMAEAPPAPPVPTDLRPPTPTMPGVGGSGTGPLLHQFGSDGPQVPVAPGTIDGYAEEVVYDSAGHPIPVPPRLPVHSEVLPQPADEAVDADLNDPAPPVDTPFRVPVGATRTSDQE